jgi:hypothetical protein
MSLSVELRVFVLFAHAPLRSDDPVLFDPMVFLESE